MIFGSEVSYMNDTTKQEKNMSRRHFMTLAGGVAGVAALSTMGVPPGCGL